MLDDLNPGARDGRDGHKDAKVPQTAKARPAKDREVRSAVEREVPLGQHEERVLAPSIHAWLDGELPEAAVRKGDTARDVEFWRNLNGQMERARRMRTPDHVESQIMAALPHHAPQIITPWWEREFVITPFAAVAATAGIIAVTAAVTAALIAP